jgi:hypothetical protein
MLNYSVNIHLQGKCTLLPGSEESLAMLYIEFVCKPSLKKHAWIEVKMGKPRSEKCYKLTFIMNIIFYAALR